MLSYRDIFKHLMFFPLELSDEDLNDYNFPGYIVIINFLYECFLKLELCRFSHVFIAHCVKNMEWIC